MKTNNAINTFFETPEQYTAFINAWKSFIAEGKHAKYPVRNYVGQYHKVSDLKCVHHLIYAALRGKDISNNFTPKNKLPSHSVYQAFASALSSVGAASRNDHWFKEIDQVFSGTVTQDMLKRLYTDLSTITLN